MSNERQETISDIVAEMRKDIAEGTVGIWSDFGGEIARRYADRIGAAWKREREATPEKSSVVANAAKMREALSDACYAMFNFLKTQNGGYEEMAEALDKAKSVLSAPPRNCDVGTADEQHARFYSFCDKIEECKECPLWRGGGLTSKCCAHWGQMPYEEGDAK